MTSEPARRVAVLMVCRRCQAEQYLWRAATVPPQPGRTLLLPCVVCRARTRHDERGG